MRKFFFLFSVYFINLIGFAQQKNVLPVPVERTIEFSTTEGSNMSVDVSPDGNKIVFDLLGDLYLLSIKGGIARQITRGMAVNTHPVWSPGGSQIAYISDASGVDRITVTDTLGSFQQTMEDELSGVPIWDATGQCLTSSLKADGNLLYYVGGGITKLAKDVSNIAEFSVDGRFVYGDESSKTGNRVISSYDLYTGKKNVLLEYGKKGERVVGPRLSQDGRWFTYQIVEGTEYTLMLLDRNEKKERVLAVWTCHIARSIAEISRYPRYAFSPDSKKVIIGYGGKIHSIDVVSGRDEIIPFVARVKVDMGHLNHYSFSVPHIPLDVKYIRSAHTSPDGKQLIFSALGRVYIMDLPGGVPRVLIDQPFGQFQPAWSLDGKWITYVSWSDKEYGQVWKVDAKGSRAIQITKEPGTYHYPSWSPGGDSIVVLKGELRDGKPVLGRRDGLGKGALVVIALESGEQKIVSDSVPLSNRPVFSSMGDSILYTPSRVGSQGKSWPYLVSKNRNGETDTLAVAETVSLATILVNEFFLRQVLRSPDGRYIVYWNEDNLYLAPLIHTGRAHKLYSKTDELSVIRFAHGGIDPHWEKGGSMLSWSVANKYYQVDPGKIVKAAIDSAQKGRTGGTASGVINVDIIPDKAVTIDLKVPRNIEKGLVALTNARIITMKGSQVIEKGTLLINNGRIVGVGESFQVKIPGNAKVIDVSGKTIMPGLIDLHDHVGLPAEIFPQQKWDLKAALAYGITTAREPSGSFDSFGYEELIEAGKMVGPRLYNVGFAVRSDRYPGINNLQEARIIVQSRAQMGAKVVKQYKLDTRLQRQWLLLACREAGLNMTNEVEKNMRGFIGHVKDGTSGIEHNPIWGDAYEDIIKLVAASGTYLTPALQAAYGTDPAIYQFIGPYCEEDKKLDRFYGDNIAIIKTQCYNAFKAKQSDTIRFKKRSFLNQSAIDAAILKQGGKVTMGSHGEDPGLGAHFEIWALQMGGITNLQALQAATIGAAGALGMQQDIGSIEPGKIADLLILNKNPLKNIQHTIDIQYVMKDGVLYDGNTLKRVVP